MSTATSSPVLVTGGGGFLGRYIVEQLLANGAAVRIYSRGDYPELAALGVDVRQGDLRDADAVSSAVEGVESVFHVAALPGIWGAWREYHGINTTGTRNVLEACRKHGVSRLVYTSSPSVVFDGEPHVDADESLPYPAKYLCHYPHSKALAEQMVLATDGDHDLKTVSLRPHLIWGPRDNHLIPRLIERARQGKLIRVGDGSNVVSVSYVENAAAAHLQAWKELEGEGRCRGKAYFINEPEPVNLWNWVNEILDLVKLPPVKKKISANLAWTLGACCEGAYSLLRKQSEPPMTRFLALQLSQSHSYSIDRAKQDFGYDPMVTFEEAMRRLKAWLT